MNLLILLISSYSIILFSLVSTQLTPAYGPVSLESADSSLTYRGMPSLQYVSWTHNQTTNWRFIRSFQISPDDGSMKTQIYYHTGGSFANTSNWHPALDMATGKPLSEVTHLAKVNNFFNTSTSIVTIDEKVNCTTIGNVSTWSVMRRESLDGGRSWTSTQSPVNLTGAVVLPGDSRIFQRVVRLPDKTLVVPYYAPFTLVKGRKFSSHLLMSTDEGRSWRMASTVFQSTNNTYSESAVVQRSDGKLLMVSRYDFARSGKGYARLASKVSKQRIDNVEDLLAITWGDKTEVIVPEAVDYPDTVQGVSPMLHSMADGVLMLVFGRPANKISLSYDGGVIWSKAHNFYDNIPKNCTAKSSGWAPCSSLGSSGYMGLAVTSPTTAVVTGDNCHTNWGCAINFKYPHGRDNKLWFGTLQLKKTWFNKI